MSTMNNLEQLILGFLSQNESIRKKSDFELTNYFNTMKVQDLTNFYSILKSSTNINVQIYIGIYIKNFIEQKITIENRNELISYINSYKYDILNIILNSNLENKTINILIIALCKGLSYFQIDMKNYNQIIYDISSYILQFYFKQKKVENQSGALIAKALFICSRFMKYIDKDIKELKFKENLYMEKNDNDEIDHNIDNENEKFEKLNLNFYNVIVEDYQKLFQSMYNDIVNNNIINCNNGIFEYIILFMKIFKYCWNYLEPDNREKILDLNYKLLITIFNQLINDNNIFELPKIFSDIIFLSNKITIKYFSTHIFNLTLNTIKNYCNYFSSFIMNENLFSKISNFLKSSETNNVNYFSKDIKFILDIIDFFHKLIELVYINFPEYKILSKKNKDNDNNNNLKQIINFVQNEFLLKEQLKSILYFIIKKCLIFNEYEVKIAQENCENFYLCFTDFSSLYDLKMKSGALCTLIYTSFRKKNLDIFNELENELVALTLKEDNILLNGQYLSGDELNLKCGLLLFFSYISEYFSLYNEKGIQIVNKIFLEQLDIQIIKKKGKEVFSTFIIIRILTQIISNNMGKNDFKKKIVDKICEIYFSNDIKEILLDLSCLDLFNEYIESQSISNNNNIFPDLFFQNYLIKISNLINTISSPELLNKIVDTTNNIINCIPKEKLIMDFNIIIPCMEVIWSNKKNNMCEGMNNCELLRKNREIGNQNKTYLIRRNMLNLISIIIQKIGLYDYNNKINSKNFIQFHELIYKMVYYYFNYSTNEEIDYLNLEIYNLIILIQDNFALSINLPSYKNILNIKDILLSIQNDENNNFEYFSKFFDFFNKILEKSITLDNNKYIFPQLFIIEQFLSFCFIPKINDYIQNENFIDKIIYIINNILNQSLDLYYQYIFNIMEYILYIINTFSNFSSNNVNKYTDFIYQFIIRIINEVELNKNNFNIYFGAIQLSNRLIYVNACKNIISDEFDKQILNIVSSVFNFWKNNQNDVKINCLQKNIMQNCVENLNKLIKNEDNIMIKDIYNEIKKNNKHIYNYDNTSNHWLFFFNQISNNLHFYKFTNDEDKLKYEWTEKLEKNELFISINKEFHIKYFFLKIDPMLKDE